MSEVPVVGRVDEIRQRLEAATTGPWERPAANVFRVIAPHAPHHNPRVGLTPPYPWRIICDAGASAVIEEGDAANAALIAAAPDDIAWLLEQLETAAADRVGLLAEQQRLRQVEAAYIDAVEALHDVTTLPLSTTLGHLIRSGYLVPISALVGATVEVWPDADASNDDDREDAKVVDAVRIDGRQHLVVVID